MKQLSSNRNIPQNEPKNTWKWLPAEGEIMWKYFFRERTLWAVPRISKKFRWSNWMVLKSHFQMGKKYPKTAPLERVTSLKTILYIWATRIILSKGLCKIYKQNIVFLKEIVEYRNYLNKRRSAHSIFYLSEGGAHLSRGAH